MNGGIGHRMLEKLDQFLTRVFHIVHKGPHTTVKKVMPDVGHHGNDKTKGRRQKGLADAVQEKPEGGIASTGPARDREEGLYHSKDRAKKSQQRCYAGNGRNCADTSLEDRNLNKGSFLGSHAHAALGRPHLQENPFDNTRNRSRHVFAEGQRFKASSLAQEIPDPVEKLGRPNLPAVEEKRPLHKKNKAKKADREKNPHHRPSLLDQGKIQGLHCHIGSTFFI